MANKKDPFNFDDIYRQAGVEDLFVKKSLADMKKPSTPPPVAPQYPSRPPDPAPAATYASPSISQHNSPRPDLAPPSVPQARPSATLSSDPFASLGIGSRTSQAMGSQRPKPQEIPKPAPPSYTPSAPATTHVNAPAAGTIDLDDMFGLGVSTTTAKPTASISDADPFAAFGDVEGALPAYTSPSQPASSHASNAALVDLDDTFGNLPPAPAAPAAVAPLEMTGNSDITFMAQSISTTPALAQQPVQAPPQTTAPAPSPRPVTPPTSLPAQPPPSAPIHTQLQDARPVAVQQPAVPPRRESPLAAQQPRPQADPTLQRPSSKFFSQYADQPNIEPVAPQRTTSQERMASGSGEDSSGLKGLFKIGANFGKKALKAVKAGLGSMIENLDRDRVMETAADTQPGTQPGKEMSSDEILAHAISISEMPSSKQEDALCRLPRPMRLRVIQLLREQALLEAEAPPDIDVPTYESISNGPQGTHDEDDHIRTSEYDLGGSAPTTSPSPPAPVQSAPPQRSTAPVPQEPPQAAPEPAPRPPPQPQPDLFGISNPEPTPAPSTPPAPPQHDLLGVGSTPTVHAPEADLLGFSDGPPPPAVPPAAPATDIIRDVSEVDDFFSGGSAAPTSPTHSHQGVHRQMSVTKSAPNLDDFFSGGKPAAPAVPKSSSMVDLGLGGTSATPDDDEGDPNEPEVRKRLRAARLAERDARMAAALAEKKAKEEAEVARRAEQVDLKDKLHDTVNAWKNKNKGNIRGMLGSLQTVLWENSGWQPMSVGDLLEPSQVRKAYMKANLIVHPDKVRQKNGSAEMIAIADMVFDTLKEAWGLFQK